MKNVVKLAPSQAEQIAKRNRRDWGAKSDYFATPEELEILLRAHATVIRLNEPSDNKDWVQRVRYDGMNFVAITGHKINPESGRRSK